jgi:hypothetical protein
VHITASFARAYNVYIYLLEHPQVPLAFQGVGSTGAVYHATRASSIGTKAPSKEQAPQQDHAAIKAYKILADNQTDGRYMYNEVLRQLYAPVMPWTSTCSM